MRATDTPWGPAKDLRKRMLPPGRGGSAEATARNQRERLYGATVATVAEKGYGDTTVADLLELAGVSRSTFYQHFADKQACFMATYDAILDGVVAASTAEFESDGQWIERLDAAYAKLLELIAAYPAAAHLCLVDLYGAGPEALAGSEQAVGQFAQLLRRALDESPERADLPEPLIQAILGGNFKVLTSRVRRGRAGELPELVPEIAAWALSYQPPPSPIRKPRSRSQPTGGGPQFAPYGDAGRIYEALALEISERGYQHTTIDGIATRAGASVHTFYRNFDGKESALAAAYDTGLVQSLALIQPAFERAVDWPHGVRAALRALLCFLAGNPAWTRTAILESPAAGAAMMARADDAIDRFASILEPGLEWAAPDLSAVAVEASAGAIYALIYEHVRKPGPARLLEILPLCTFVGLAPFVGAELALAIANDGERSDRRVA